jgi:hypothetical protein
MKRLSVCIAICLAIFSAAYAIHSNAEAAKRERAVMKALSDRMDKTSEETIRTLEAMPKIGK